MMRYGTGRNSLTLVVLSALLLFCLNQIWMQNSSLSLDEQTVQQQDEAKVITRSNSTATTPTAASSLTKATSATTSSTTGSSWSSHHINTNTSTSHDDHAVFQHELLSPKSTANSILTTSSSDYKWVGKAWIPPEGVPVFTPSQIRTYLTKYNILILGDSTSRRIHQTINGMINAEDLNDVKLTEMDDATKLSLNKDGKDTSCVDFGDRAIVNLPGRNYIACINLEQEKYQEGGEESVEVDTHDIVKNNSTMMTATKKHITFFDHGILYCYKPLSWMWRDDDTDDLVGPRGPRPNNSNWTMNTNVQIFQRDYDVIIIAMGIWELSQLSTCLRNTHPNSTVSSRLAVALDRIHRNTPSSLRVVFRTSAFDTRYTDNDQSIRDANTVARHFFEDMRRNLSIPESNNEYNINHHNSNHDPSFTINNNDFLLVDWGAVMDKRSFNDDRIAGDHPAHYGIEARTLFIQQLMHELVKADLMKTM